MEYDWAQKLQTDTMADLDDVCLSPVISSFMDGLTDHQLHVMQVVMRVSIPREQMTLLMQNIVKIVTKTSLKVILPKLTEVLKMDPHSLWISKPGFFQELRSSTDRLLTSVSRGEGQVFYSEPLEVLFEVDEESVLKSAQESLRCLGSLCNRCSSTSSCELSADIDISKTSLEAPSDTPSPRFQMQSCKEFSSSEEELLDDPIASVLKNTIVNEHPSPHSLISLRTDGSSPTILSISTRSISRTSSSDYDVLILPGISLLSSEIKNSFLQRTSPMIRGDGAKSSDRISITTLVDCLMAALDLDGAGHFNTPVDLFVATRRLDDFLSKGTTHNFTCELTKMVHLVLDRRMIPLRSTSDTGFVSGEQEHTDAHSSFACDFLCDFAEESVKRLFMSCVFPRPNSASSEDLPSLMMPFNVTPNSFEVSRCQSEVFTDMVDLFTTIMVRQIIYILCAPSDANVDELLRQTLAELLQKFGGDSALHTALNPQDAVFDEALMTAQRKQLDAPASSASAALPAEKSEANSKKGIFSCLKMPKLNILKKLRMRKSNKVCDGTLHATVDEVHGPSHRTSDPGTSSSSSSVSKKVKRTNRSIFGTMLSALRRCIARCPSIYGLF